MQQTAAATMLRERRDETFLSAGAHIRSGASSVWGGCFCCSWTMSLLYFETFPLFRSIYLFENITCDTLN